jgi:hypothetical protein
MMQRAGRVGLAVVVVLAVGLGVLARPVSARAEDTPTATAAAASDPTGAPGGASNTPQPVGRLVPTARQRIADNLAWVWVMALLVGGGALAVWLARREDGADAQRVDRPGTGGQ